MKILTIVFVVFQTSLISAAEYNVTGPALFTPYFFEYLEPVQGFLIVTLPTLPKVYTLSLEIKVIATSKNQWSNVIHLTTGENKGSSGFRLPAIFIYENKLRISQDVNGEVMHDTDAFFEVNKWISIVISSSMVNSSYIYTLVLNGKKVDVIKDRFPHSYKNVKVYISDPWYPASNLIIRDFSISLANEPATYAASAPAQDLHISPTPETSTEDLKALLSSPNVIYLNSKDILDGKKELPSLSMLRMNVIFKKIIYFINFTDTTGTEHANDVKNLVLNKYLVDLPGDYLIVTRHKGNVLFTQVDDIKGANNNNPNGNPILAPEHMKALMAQHFEPFMEMKPGTFNTTVAITNDTPPKT